jgi:hypothetical protein
MPAMKSIGDSASILAEPLPPDPNAAELLPIPYQPKAEVKDAEI